MIVVRYLIREILLTMMAVTGVLLLVIMGSRFIRYFASAAEGDFPASLLGSLMLSRIPGFMELILPLAFFLGILLAYGQLYLNSEMTVLRACGVSSRRLLSITLWPATLVALLVAVCSLWLTPYGLAHNERVLTEQKQRADFSLLSPGRFQTVEGNRTVYAEAITQDSSHMEDVFIAERETRSDGTSVPVVTRAQSGYQVNDDEAGTRYLVLSNGERYSVSPGDAESERLQFDTYAVRLDRAEPPEEFDDAELLPTSVLWSSDDLEARAALQWRISLILMVPILTLIALPLAKVNPRQGRFAKLLPAIFLHISYLSLLLAAQNAVGEGQLSPTIGLWPIHAVYLVVGLWLLGLGRGIMSRNRGQG
ncbi:LPS export ABC transporter permease LptF [Phytohalomonas tamaricis]|uniref:LPS export ABC transporter permease LptF n=1 Tax=Phytohalomonas tamaricis TaxID=2081032 RepID=UPI000D0B9473|nr:LPS export ABC transporter permease LptF [Phytohalomonas tamaricis]